jgi:hypothetical protein
MSELNFVAVPRSRKDIRRWAEVVRSLSGNGREPRFDIVRFVELRLPLLDEEAAFAVTDDLGPGIHACTDIRARCIMIRPEIYERAVAGHGRDRMTLAHEVGHLLLHTEVQLARRIGAAPIEAFRDPEWQAKAFAGELMVPRSLYPTGKHPAEVATLLGVSVDAVSTQLRAWKRER